MTKQPFKKKAKKLPMKKQSSVSLTTLQGYTDVSRMFDGACVQVRRRGADVYMDVRVHSRKPKGAMVLYFQDSPEEVVAWVRKNEVKLGQAARIA